MMMCLWPGFEIWIKHKDNSFVRQSATTLFSIVLTISLGYPGSSQMETDFRLIEITETNVVSITPWWIHYFTWSTRECRKTISINLDLNLSMQYVHPQCSARSQRQRARTANKSNWRYQQLCCWASYEVWFQSYVSDRGKEQWLVRTCMEV